MPLYFFHRHAPHGLASDTFGVDLPDLDAARNIAVHGLRSMLAEGSDELPPHEIIEIEDEAGRVVMTVPVADALVA